MPEYRFAFERALDVLTRSAMTVDDEDLAVEIAGALGCDDPDEEPLVVFRRADLETIASALTDPTGGREDRAALGRSADRLSVRRHEDCELIVRRILQSRNDLIQGVIDAQSHMFNDISMGEYGDLYVDFDMLLRLLRPRPDDPRALLEPEYCGWCAQCFTHEEDCPRGRRESELEERRPHEIASHIRCEAIVEELWDQYCALGSEIEEVASYLIGVHQFEYGMRVVAVDDSTVSRLELADMHAGELLRAPKSLSAEIPWPIEAIQFCRHDVHSTPHRACRYLIS